MNDLPKIPLAFLNNPSCYEGCPPQKMRKKLGFPHINAVFPRIDPRDDLTKRVVIGRVTSHLNIAIIPKI